MKNNYNPFTVPENFFEDTCKRAVSGYRGKRRAIHYGAAALIVAVALIVTPLFLKTSDAKDQETVAVNLAEMYEYDIFLQVNFLN